MTLPGSLVSEISCHSVALAGKAKAAKIRLNKRDFIEAGLRRKICGNLTGFGQ
jgi:hypothetical protein